MKISEEKRLELLAKLYKTFTSPLNTELKFDSDDEIILRDLQTRELINPNSDGFLRTMSGHSFKSTGGISPLTAQGIQYLEKTKIDKFIDHPVYKLLKEIRQFL